MHVAEFTLHAKPGHYDEVAELYSACSPTGTRPTP